ncbi:MAG: fibronectin type III domain-containing protein [Candidatus Eisenbacteria bacterium]|nr:fibronectin type III domain-containing protein [Candidatus Eisenbacteria bacterium]
MRIRSLAGIAVLFATIATLVTAGTAAAQTVTWNSVQISWTTPGDDSLTGTASQFDIRYSTAAITAANFSSATRWNSAPVPAAPGTRQSTVVTGLQPTTTYWFAMKTADEVPNWSGISNIISRTTLAAPDTIRPAQIANVSVTGMTETSATLSWAAVGDDSLTGNATSYDIRWSRSPITAANWASATTTTGAPTPGAPGTTQTFAVIGLTRQTTYYFAIKAIDDAGNPSALSNVPSATTPDQTRPAAINDLVVGFLWLHPSVTETMIAAVPRRMPGRYLR